MAWLIVDAGTYEQNLAVCNQLETLTNLKAGYPNNMGTDRYGESINHPNGVKFAFPVEPGVEAAYYNDPEVKALVDGLVPDAPNKLVAALPAEGCPDQGDGE